MHARGVYRSPYYFACIKGNASFKFGGILDHVLNFVSFSLSSSLHLYFGPIGTCFIFQFEFVFSVFYFLFVVVYFMIASWIVLTKFWEVILC